MNKISGWQDTIVALATPSGIGAIAVIRLSGARSFAIADSIFPSKNLSTQKSHTVHFGKLNWEGKAVDEVLVSIFIGPHSFTGEDTVEISCHGSKYIQAQILRICVLAGARIAKPGEFTQRAFLNGKLDLSQAESVADLIAANTAAASQNALANMRGGFSSDIASMREQLIQFASLIELELDFATEDVEFADRLKFEQLIEQLQQKTQSLLQSFSIGNVLKNGVSVAIIGKPNAGKSTLLNALLNEERAIVSNIAGTTRDTIEEALTICGIEFRLIDTAGIRSHTHDSIEAMGMERSKDNALRADIVLHVIDALEPEDESIVWLDSLGSKLINVYNKSDKLPSGKSNTKDGLRIAAKTGEGIEQLKSALYQKATDGKDHSEGTIVTNARHVESLQKLSDSLDKIKEGISSNLSGDLLALEIRTALFHLGEITGEVTTEDKLDYIFSKFCIGK